MPKKNNPNFSDRYHNHPTQKRISTILRGVNLTKFREFQNERFLSESKALEKIVEKYFENKQL